MTSLAPLQDLHLIALSFSASLCGGSNAEIPPSCSSESVTRPLSARFRRIQEEGAALARQFGSVCSSSRQLSVKWTVILQTAIEKMDLSSDDGDVDEDNCPGTFDPRSLIEIW